MTHDSRSLYPAFSPGDDKPLAEQLLPLGDDKRAVLSQMWPEGILSAIGFLDPVTGEFVGTSGHFRAFRPAPDHDRK